jgi:hypothetical protein
LRRALDVFIFRFIFSSTAKSAGGFVCPSCKVAGSKPKTKKKTGPARRHRGDIRMSIDLPKPIAPIFAAAPAAKMLPYSWAKQERRGLVA